MDDQFSAALQIVEENNAPLPDGALPTGNAEPIEYAPLAKLLDYNQPTDAQKEQLDAVWKYFSRETKNEGEALANMRAMERSLAAPEIGQTRLSRIYTYVRLLEQSDSLEQEKKAYQK